MPGCISLKYDYVLWDWNGTLLDDVCAALDCVNEMLDGLNRERIGLERYCELIDTPIINFYYGLFGTRDIDFNTISEQFHTAYGKRVDGLRLMPDAERMLGYIHGLGIKQLIVTSAHAGDVRRQISKRGIERYFECIIGADDKYARSKTERAQLYFKQLPQARLLMVGDTLHDLQTARALGADCVLLTSGHQGPSVLAAADCFVTDGLDTLVDILKED